MMEYGRKTQKCVADKRYSWVPGEIKKLFTFPLAFLYLRVGRESDHLSGVTFQGCPIMAQGNGQHIQNKIAKSRISIAGDIALDEW